VEWVDPLGLVCKEALKNVEGITYTGRMHRMEKPEQTKTTWTAGSWNVDASHRYSDRGLGAIYGGTNKKTALAEVQHYDEKFGYDTSQRKYKYKDVNVDNMLDLTDPSVRDKLGITLDDLIGTGKDKYKTTHEIGNLASEVGFNGVIAPSARNPAGANVVIFGGF
jgi:RES domain-containing protein